MLKRLSPRAELLLINLICFGPFAARSIIELAARNESIVFDNRRALFILGTEIVCGTLALLLLRARGWTLASLGLRITMPQTIGGMLLLLGSNIVITVPLPPRARGHRHRSRQDHVLRSHPDLARPRRVEATDHRR